MDQKLQEYRAQNPNASISDLLMEAVQALATQLPEQTRRDLAKLCLRLRDIENSKDRWAESIGKAQASSQQSVATLEALLKQILSMYENFQELRRSLESRRLQKTERLKRVEEKLESSMQKQNLIEHDLTRARSRMSEADQDIRKARTDVDFCWKDQAKELQ